jgi:glycerol-3-phosphate dehydrogenase subunit C
MSDTPEKKIRSVIDQCADCEQCRDVMAEVCPFFPRLYNLSDHEMDGSAPITSMDLRGLVDQCNFCGLCPCPDIRARIMEAKSAFIRRDGMPLRTRLIQDVEKIGRHMNRFPGLSNALVRSRVSSGLIKKMAGIHPDRVLPEVPARDFSEWAGKEGLYRKDSGKHTDKTKVAFFAGCSARYFFPEVAKAAVKVLRKNRIKVNFPPQKCCSMPAMLEGDASFTRELMSCNLKYLADSINGNYDIVCSCPTCGYMFKKLLREKACYSRPYQELVGGGETFMLVPVESGTAPPEKTRHRSVHRAMYSGILKDDGVFSSLSPLKRIEIARKTFDLGEYLMKLFEGGDLDTDFSGMDKKIVYYPPCHTREQDMGLPYAELLGLISGLEVQVAEGAYLCCGMAGVMGCKKDFHDKSLEMAGPLLQKIRDMKPDILVTECLSCRLQFMQTLPFALAHPVEIIARAYGIKEK